MAWLYLKQKHPSIAHSNSRSMWFPNCHLVKVTWMLRCITLKNCLFLRLKMSLVPWLKRFLCLDTGCKSKRANFNDARISFSPPFRSRGSPSSAKISWVWAMWDIEKAPAFSTTKMLMALNNLHLPQEFLPKSGEDMMSQLQITSRDSWNIFPQETYKKKRDLKFKMLRRAYFC